MATSKARPAAKAAPAPAPVAVEEEGATLEVGTIVRFAGYDDSVPENERVLVAGEEYEVTGFTEAEGDDPGGNPIVQAPNPDFNPKKKEHPDTNPKMIDVEALADELEVVEGEAEAEEEVEAAPEPVKAAPAKAAKTAAKAAPAKAAAAPAKAGKAAAAPAKAGKTKAVAAAVPEPVEPVDKEAVPDLEHEDADVLALVEGGEDLIATAQQLESEANTAEYQLGGVLYHIKKDKAHHALSPEYAEPGGFDKFLQEYFTMEYRKAQYLIEIYVHFNLAGIEDAAAKVAAIGWTKAKTIAKELSKPEAKPEELLELAGKMTVVELSQAIKDSVRVGGTPGEVKARLRLKFSFLEEEGAVVEGILKAAMEQLGLKTLEAALSHIVQEWAAANGGGTATKASAPTQRAAAPAAKKAAPARRVAAAA